MRKTKSRIHSSELIGEIFDEIDFSRVSNRVDVAFDEIDDLFEGIFDKHQKGEMKITQKGNVVTGITTDGDLDMRGPINLQGNVRIRTKTPTDHFAVWKTFFKRLLSWFYK
ncbi:hypothetical protein KAR91_16070 [Candidatus Pacearchaeota archaeon]|nr:hypothetical protein [Candidatus Pacearchaeota archaeon]